MTPISPEVVTVGGGDVDLVEMRMFHTFASFSLQMNQIKTFALLSLQMKMCMRLLVMDTPRSM